MGRRRLKCLIVVVELAILRLKTTKMSLILANQMMIKIKEVIMIIIIIEKIRVIKSQFRKIKLLR